MTCVEYIASAVKQQLQYTWRILRTPILTNFAYMYRKTLYVCVARSLLSVLTSRVSNAYIFVVKNLYMARVHLPNTRRHKFVGDVTTIWFFPDYQFPGRTECLVGCMWPRGRMFHLAGSYVVRLLPYYLTWVTSGPIHIFGNKCNFFLWISQMEELFFACLTIFETKLHEVRKNIRKT